MKLTSLLLFSAAVMGASSVQAQERLSFLTSWRAQAEHGGYYQAQAKGYYRQCGVDLTIRQAGPGINGQQMFVAGAVDLMMASHSETVMQINQQGFSSKAVMAAFQFNPQVLITHQGNGIETFEDMKGKPIMIGASSRSSFWPFLRTRFGFTDAQLRPYSGQIAPWLVDKGAIQQGLVTNEPFRIEKQTGQAPKVFMLSDAGWSSYASIIIAPDALIEKKPQAIQCFVDASRRGWNEFLNGDIAPALALIRKDNPDNPDDVVDYVIRTLKERQIVLGGDAPQLGVGAMTEARWKAFADEQVAAGLIAPTFDHHAIYTTRFLQP